MIEMTYYNIMAFEYNIKYGKYKNISLKVDRLKNITVTAPSNINVDLVQNFVNSKTEWIQKTLDRIESKNDTEIKVEGNKILLFGEFYDFVFAHNIGKEMIVNHHKKEIYASKNLITNSELLLKFYKREALFYIPSKIYELAKKFGFVVNGIKVRKTKSIYGSCSSKGIITISERIIVAPKEVIDSIIIHELTHLNYMNHSKFFYDKLYELFPNYKICNNWLKEKMPKTYPPARDVIR